MPRLPFVDLRSRRGRTYAFLLVAIAGLGWAVYSAIDAVRPIETLKVSMFAGSTVERRYQIAQHLAEEAEQAKVQISLVQANGLEDLLTKFSTRQVDAGIVSLGLNVRDVDHIQVLAGLDAAPLHILARRDILAQGNSLIEVLKNRRINLGQPSTNDHALGIEVMNFLRLNGKYTAIEWSKEQLVRHAESVIQANPEEHDTLAQDLPEVAMVVASLPSNVVQRLLDTQLYELVPFPYSNNFLMSDSADPHGEIQRRCVESVVIPAAMYVSDTPIPAQDCPSIGLRSLLVAHADMPEETVWRLMDTVFDSAFTHRMNPIVPNKIVASVPVHSAATSYLERTKPLMTGDFFEKFSDGLSIFGAFIAGALSLYGYLRRRRIRGPSEYLEEIRNVDSLVNGYSAQEPNALKTPDTIAMELDARLVKLKLQLIEDYCNNRVQGELVVMSVLSMLSDTRAQLRRASAAANSSAASRDSDKSTPLRVA